MTRVYNMDCMEAMKGFPDKYFDLAVVDPPYGIGIDGQKLSISKNPKHNRKEHAKKNWDKHIPPRNISESWSAFQRTKLYGAQIISLPPWSMDIKAGSCGTKVSRI